MDTGQAFGYASGMATHPYSIRMTPELMSRVDRLASRDERKRNQQLVWLIRRQVEAEEQEGTTETTRAPRT